MAAAKARSSKPTLPVHGASTLPSVIVDAYNCEFEDAEGFVGDRASKSAFHDILDRIRKISSDDPFGKSASDEIGKKKLGETLTEGEAEAAAVVQGAVESFALRLAGVIKRFLRLKAWRDTECIVIGGGFRAGRIGELAIARTGILLKEDDVAVVLQPIHTHPDEAGLVGAVHLLPPWMLRGHDGMLAVDIGGSNIRAGIIEHNIQKAADLSKACIFDMKLWRHKDDNPDRDGMVDHLVDMLSHLAKDAGRGEFNLAPSCRSTTEPAIALSISSDPRPIFLAGAHALRTGDTETGMLTEVIDAGGDRLLVSQCRLWIAGLDVDGNGFDVGRKGRSLGKCRVSLGPSESRTGRYAPTSTVVLTFSNWLLLSVRFEHRRCAT